MFQYFELDLFHVHGHFEQDTKHLMVLSRVDKSAHFHFSKFES